jgi:hypothetical protein
MSKSSTSFKPGQSGNPAGRPKDGYAANNRLKAYCRQFGEEAIGVILAVMRDPKEAGKTRIYAAELVLNRGFGKPDVDKSGEAGEVPERITNDQADRVLGLLQSGALSAKARR